MMDLTTIFMLHLVFRSDFHISVDITACLNAVRNGFTSIFPPGDAVIFQLSLSSLIHLPGPHPSCLRKGFLPVSLLAPLFSPLY